MYYEHNTSTKDSALTPSRWLQPINTIANGNKGVFVTNRVSPLAAL